MRYYRTYLFLILIAFFNTASAQEANSSSLDSFSGKLITAIRSHEKQRALLVTDKSFFSAGENIWFKVFLLNAVTQKVNTKSKFLFVDLVNEKDKVLKVMILDAAKQQLHSRMFLPDSLPEGYYWLRAYTRQMVVGDTNGIAVKSIYIASKNTNNRFSEMKRRNMDTDSSLLFHFFPEGVTMMTGINTSVAFCSNNKTGLPENITGYVKDNRDTVVARFTSNANGMGKFEFEPSRYRKYSAVVSWHGKEISYPLPAFNFRAAQLSAVKQPGGYKFRILLEDSIYRKDFETYIVGICRDSMVFAGIGKGLYEVMVDKQKLPEGITTFYLFDKNFKELSERSVYTRDNAIHIKVSTDKNIYGKKDKVVLNVSITDAMQLPVTALVSVSVTDERATGQEMKPGLNNEAYNGEMADELFLSRNETLSEEDADLMMLVKRSSYQLLSQYISPVLSNGVDSLLYIKGVLHNEKNEPYANTALTLFSNSGDDILFTDTTNSMGRFRFPVDYYRDSAQFAIEARDIKGHKQLVRIETDALNYPVLHTPSSLKTYLPLPPAEIKKYFNAYREDESLEDGKGMLPRVTVKTKKKVNYDESKRKSAFSNIITSDDMPDGVKVSNAVLKVAGMHVLNGVLVVNGLTSMHAPDAGSEPILMVEGAQISAAAEGGETSPVLSYLNTLNPKDIDFIEVLKGPEAANYGMHGGNGVILVNLLSKRRDLDENNNNLKTFYTKGVSNPALFSDAGYQKKDTKTEVPAVADKRSTLFWNGNLLHDKAVNTTLTFYTSDVPAIYKATVTGITAHGDIIYKTISFQSK
jgi:hypothetical protein